jgi:hypothetical protein
MGISRGSFMDHSLRLKTLLTLAACLWLCLGVTPPVRAQGTSSETERAMREEAQRRAAQAEANREMQQNKQQMINRSRTRGAESKAAGEATLTAEQKRFLAASVEDQAKFAEFLKQPNTGMIRLFPQGKFASTYTISADEPEGVLPIKGGGAYYSFGRKTHEFGEWSDLCLRENVLYTGLDQQSFGLFTVLGDVPPESISLKNPEVEILQKLVPPKHFSEVAGQRQHNAAGFKVGEIHYGSAFRVIANLSYVMRSINYRRPDSLSQLKSPRLAGSTSEDGSAGLPRVPAIVPQPYEGADVLIAFRVIRQDPEEGITIVWKQLKKSSAPQLKSEKR